MVLDTSRVYVGDSGCLYYYSLGTWKFKNSDFEDRGSISEDAIRVDNPRLMYNQNKEYVDCDGDSWYYLNGWYFRGNGPKHTRGPYGELTLLFSECKPLEAENKSSNVEHPDHYNQGDIECIDAIHSMLTEEEFRGWVKGNIVKYSWRERFKGGDEDLEKIIFYANWLIENG